MRSGNQCLLIALLAAGASLGATAVDAQGVPRYSPQTPTLSPYLNLLQADRGPLPNYFTLVRPLQRQAQLNQQAGLELRRQATEIEQTRVEFGQRAITATGKASWFFNFGERNQFGQTSHFYGQWPQAPLRGSQRR